MSASCDLSCFVSIFTVAALWGATNPLMRLGSIKAHGKPNTKGTSHSKWLTPLYDLIHLVLNWQFFVPFAFNQLASILFTFLVTAFPMSVVVPSVNSLQFVFTAIVGSLLGEKMTPRTAIGCLFIFSGVALMIYADTN